MKDASDHQEMEEVYGKYEPNVNGNLDFESYFAVIMDEHKAVKQIMRVLDEIDTDGDDYISREEMFAHLIENEGIEMPDEELDAILERLDANKDGKLHKGEVALLEMSEQVHDYAKELLRRVAGENISAIVSELDADGSGHLGFSELQESLLLAEWTDEQIEALLEFVNIEEDNVVRVEEAVDVLIREEMRKIQIGKEFYQLTKSYEGEGGDEHRSFFTSEDVKRVKSMSPQDALAYVNSQDENGDGEVTYGEMCRANLQWFMCPGEDEGEPSGPADPEDEFDAIWY